MADRNLYAIGVVTVDKPVIVVVEVVVAELERWRAVGVESTRWIGAIDDVVAIVVETVVTNFGYTVFASGANDTVGIGAVDASVAIVVDIVVTSFGFWGSLAGTGTDSVTIGIRAVDEEVAVVVAAVAAVLRQGHTRALLASGAVAVVAVVVAIAIVIETVGAHPNFVRGAATRFCADAVGVVAIDGGVAVVVDAVAAELWFGNAPAVRNILADWIKTVRDAVAVIVVTVEAVFNRARKSALIEVVAVVTPANRRLIAVLIEIEE